MDVITTHINADFDCLGAMVAAKLLYPDAVMVFPGAQERNLREFFVRSTLCAYNFKRIKDIDFDQITRLILVDVCQADRIGPFGVVATRPGVELHIYDHHPDEPTLLAATRIIEKVGATVSIFTRLFVEKGILPDQDSATLMMLGLYEDTGSLLFNSTTRNDYDAASFLLSCGADLNRVADFLTQELTSDQVALLHELINSRFVLTVNGVDVSIAHASADKYVGDLAVLVHKLKDMENLNALLVVARMGDRIFMVGRSRIPDVDIGAILSEFGGGGHPFAASATLRDETLVQVLDRIPEVLSLYILPVLEARHLMSSPVKSVEIESSITEAREILNRYNLNALPVLKSGSVVGIISRQTADKAAHHNLEQANVSEYMTREIESVQPTLPIASLKELIVGHGHRIVPVVEGEQLVGVVTRTDLLRYLVTGGQRSLQGNALNRGGHHPRKKHLARLLQAQLPLIIYTLLGELGQIGDRLGIGVYAVGGFVRDLLLHKDNLDIDIVIEGDGIEFAREIEKVMECRVRLHERFGTAVVVFPDGFKLDIASTRTEYYLEPGALPNVEHASIKLDLYRRDFTINTMAVALNVDVFGDLFDFFQAQKDLQDGAIRVLHNLSFVEDPTRLFRAIRFEQRLHFNIGKHTEALLNSAVRMGFVEKIGGIRVYNELLHIFKEADPVASVQRMADFELLGPLHPALKWNDSLLHLFEEAGRALHWYELLYTGGECRSWLVYMLCLLADLRPVQVAEFCQRLHVPPRIRLILQEERRTALTVKKNMDRSLHRNKTFKNSQLYRWLNPLSIEVIVFLMAFSSAEESRQAISRYMTHLKDVKTALNGKSLQKIGLTGGPHFTKIFDTLLAARLDGRVTTEQEEIALVKKRFPAAFKS
jgi:tRNA nucleotidyltransferase (CCA-adding enzyme)